MRNCAGQRQSQVRRQRTKTGVGELQQVPPRETGRMDHLMRHQAQQPAVQQHLPTPLWDGPIGQAGGVQRIQQASPKPVGGRAAAVDRLHVPAPSEAG